MAFLGLDIAKSKVDCCLLIETSSKPKRHVIPQTQEGFNDLKSWIEKHGLTLEDLISVLEPTGVYGYDLTHWLYESKASVRVVQPTQARYFARYHKVNSKNDEIDSHMLAKMGKEKADELPVWEPPSEISEKLKFLFKRLDQSVKMRCIEENRLEGHDGIKTYENADSYTIQNIDFYKAQEQQILAEIEDLAFSDIKLKADIKLLQTIPGVGEKLGPILAVLFNSRNFTSGGQVAKFIGVIPKDNKSGSSVNSPSRMTKAGNSAIRAKLYMGAKAAVRENTRDSRIKRFYNHLINNGKTKACATGAIMHKLLVVAYGVWKNQQPYDDNYENNRRHVATVHSNDMLSCQPVNNVVVNVADSPCSERKRALRPSRTRREEHGQVEGVKAERSEPRSGCLDTKTPVLPQVCKDGALKRRTYAVNG